MKKRINHLIYSLDSGGAENVLQNLCYHTRSDVEHKIYVLKSPTSNLQLKFPSDLKVEKLNIINFFKILTSKDQSILMAWLFHAMLISSLIKILNPGIKLIWNIRYSNLPLNKLRTKVVFYLLKYLSSLPNQIIYNSYAGEEHHLKSGFKYKNSIVIQNGIDTDLFQPMQNSTIKKTALGIPENSFVVGMVARFDPLKNHSQFIDNAIKWLNLDIIKKQNIYFVFIGRGMTEQDKYKKFPNLKNNQVAKHFIFLGEKSKLHEFYQIMNVHCLYSLTEGFPNVVAESMACGVPNISTLTGDVSNIINTSNGWIFNSNTFEEFNNKFNQVISLSSEKIAEMGKAARLQIIQKFSFSNMNQKYIELIKK